MECAVLFAIEEVEHGAWRARDAFEIADRARIDIDPSGADEARLGASDPGTGALEADGAAADAAEQVCVAYLARDGGGG